uniref:Phytocyanin domain-containing protein n=1 Tax=Quercus lobata TaxID=97700 RepID=A0A7N2MYH2_QUELO
MAVSIARPFGNSINTQTSNKIIVGDMYHWNYGFNYIEWATKHGPFYLNDTLGELNYFAIATCNILPCIVQGNTKQGAGNGFEFVLKKSQPHYFACSEHDGIHCLNGTMKFFVTPIDWNYR